MTATATTTKEFWLIEKTGNDRQVWGPYATVQAAKNQAGVRHSVITGRGLSNGQTMTEGAAHAAFQSGRIKVVVA